MTCEIVEIHAGDILAEQRPVSLSAVKECLIPRVDFIALQVFEQRNKDIYYDAIIPPFDLPHRMATAYQVAALKYVTEHYREQLNRIIDEI